MSIEKQKAVADEVYSKLMLADPWCVLAGGAPRDWYLGTECNDLDFYFCSTARTLGAVRRQLDSLFGAGVFTAKCEHLCGMYKHMDSLQRIFEGKVGGMTVQLMQLHTTGEQWKVMEGFSTSICKATYHSGKITLHKEFKETLVSGTMFLTDGYKWSDMHPNKLRERFEGTFSLGTKEQARARIINNALRDIPLEGGV